MPAGGAAHCREPEDPPEDRCYSVDPLGSDAMQFVVAANPAVSIKKGAQWHLASVKSRLAGLTAPR